MNYIQAKPFIDFCMKQLNIQSKVKWKFRKFRTIADGYGQVVDKRTHYVIHVRNDLSVKSTCITIAHELAHIYQDEKGLLVFIRKNVAAWRGLRLFRLIDFDGTNHDEYDQQPHEKHANGVAYKLWRKWKCTQEHTQECTQECTHV